MKLLLTDGLGGSVISSVLRESNSTDDIFAFVDNWKSAPANKLKYKVELYNRLLFSPAENAIFIDFGDYMTFFIIICDNKTEYSDVAESITGKAV